METKKAVVVKNADNTYVTTYADGSSHWTVSKPRVEWLAKAWAREHEVKVQLEWRVS